MLLLKMSDSAPYAAHAKVILFCPSVVDTLWLTLEFRYY